MSATNRSAVRRAGDFYRTPAWVVQALLESEPLCPPFLDPAAGDGAILRELPRPSRGVEVDPGRASLAEGSADLISVGDYLQGETSAGAETTVMNPPYKLAAEFVRRALGEACRGRKVCALLRLNFLGSSRKRIDLVGQGCQLRRVIVLARRPSFTGGGTDACEYAWFVWERGYAGPTLVDVFA